MKNPLLGVGQSFGFDRNIAGVTPGSPTSQPLLAGETSTTEAIPKDDYDLEAARAEVQVVIKALKGSLVLARRRIRGRAASARRELTARADDMRQRVQTHISGNVATIRAAFEAQQAMLDVEVEKSHGNIEGQFETHRIAAEVRGEHAKTDLQKLFSNHRGQVELAIEEKISDAKEMANRHVDHVRRQTQLHASEAFSCGLAQRHNYPNTKRGRVQSSAASRVAYGVAREIKKRSPEAISAVRELTAGIPEEYRKQGEEALRGFDDGVPNLWSKVDEHVAAISTTLAGQAEVAHQRLNALHTKRSSQLRAMEEALVARAQTVGTQAAAQIDAGLREALTPFNKVIRGRDRRLSLSPKW